MSLGTRSERFGGAMLYVTLSRGGFSSFLSFIFRFWKIKYFSVPSPFFGLQVQGTLFFFLIFLFELQAQNAPYHLESFYYTSFCSLILEYVLYKIYNYAVLNHLD